MSRDRMFESAEDSAAQHRPTEPKRNTGGGWGFILIFVAMALIFGSVILGEKFSLSAMAQFVISGFGVLVLLIGTIIVVISKLYIRTSSDRSFVRTGMGGLKAIIDGGAVVIPVIHEITQVSHATMKLVVKRTGADALITGDKLRADVTAEFYIRVPKDEANTLAAAASLGSRGMDPERLKELVYEKLENALRTVAGTQPLMQLHADRKQFVEGVQEIVSKALETNGLSLEEVTISKLDQTNLAELNADTNVFDAEGARTIAQITQSNRIQRNQIEREADATVMQQNVESRKVVLAQEQDQATAEAETRRQIAEANAAADSSAAVQAADEARKSEVANVSRQQAVEVAEKGRLEAVEVADQARQRAVRTAEIEREQATDVASRNAKIAVQERDTALANAEAERQSAEALAEKARQEVATVTATESAERAKKTALIDEAAVVEKDALRDRTKADVAAYTLVTTAGGEHDAAEKRASAVRIGAEADKDAKVLAAEGERAAQMIPVDVARENVAVDQARVAVRREELQNESEFQGIAKDLQIALAQIAAGKEVDIARATAMGQALSQAEMTFWGDPETFKSMSNAFLSGQRTGKMIEGVLAGTPDSVTTLAEDTVRSLGGVAAGLVKKFTGQVATDEEAMKLVQSFFKDKSAEDIAEILKAINPSSAGQSA